MVRFLDDMYAGVAQQGLVVPLAGDLFAACPVDTFPGLAVEPVSDSSRYFVLRLQDPSGKHAFVGLGFQDRGDAFDFNVALQEHFK